MIKGDLGPKVAGVGKQNCLFFRLNGFTWVCSLWRTLTISQCSPLKIRIIAPWLCKFGDSWLLRMEFLCFNKIPEILL